MAMTEITALPILKTADIMKSIMAQTARTAVQTVDMTGIPMTAGILIHLTGRATGKY